jgi:S-adenosylmethionine:tRNA ribosyltransferase-isomerase
MIVKSRKAMRLTDFYYELPDELIARYPTEKRSGSRLLCLDSQTGAVTHKHFTDLIDLLSPNDLLVFNNTRVIPARLLGHKQTGGHVEVLVERILDTKRVLAHVRASKKPKQHSLLFFNNGISFEITGRQNDLFELFLREPGQDNADDKLRQDNAEAEPHQDNAEAKPHQDNVEAEPHQDKTQVGPHQNHATPTVLQVIEMTGEVPIPPYFKRVPDEQDKERYQTIYAKYDGSAAAPTAGLHFDADLFAQLHHNRIGIGYVTLHVGAGTFSPVRVDDITQHRMHTEYVEVDAEICKKIIQTKQAGGRVIAVGTTTVRSLETAARTTIIRHLESSASTSRVGHLESSACTSTVPHLESSAPTPMVHNLQTAASHLPLIEPYSGDTDIFIYPGFPFQCVDALVTNFHFPCSTLLMLVAAKAGHKHIMDAYRIAVSQRYRFFSYGDAMFIV